MDDQARQRLADAMRPKVKPFEIAGIGTIYLRGLTSGQRDRFDASLWKGEGDARKRDTVDGNARLVAMVWCDEDGKSLGYSEQDVAEMDGELVARIADKAVEMSGLGPRAVDDAKKNS